MVQTYEQKVSPQAAMLLAELGYDWTDTAPVQSVAMRWLREEWNFAVVVEPESDYADFNDEIVEFATGEWVYYIRDISDNGKYIHMERRALPTYEDAAEEAIRTALGVLYYRLKSDNN